MGIQDFNSLLRQGLSASLVEPIWGESVATTTMYTGAFIMQRIGFTRAIPSLPDGIVSVIPTSVDVLCSTVSLPVLCGRLTNLGSIDISGASGTFTDGSAMPSRNTLGVSRQVWSNVIAEVTTTLNATPGSLAITYNDQDNNASESTTALSLTASSVAGSACFLRLNTGDYGVVDITAATRTAGTTPTGGIRFNGIEPLALFSATFNPGASYIEDLVCTSTNLMEMVATDQIGFYVLGSTVAKSIMGKVSYVGNF